MADLPIINPTKPLWPTRRDGNSSDNPRKKDEDDDKQKDHPIDEKPKTPPDNEDGHIDEYV